MPKVTARSADRTCRLAWRFAVALLLSAMLAIGMDFDAVPPVLALYYLAASLVSFAVYGFDKRAAIRGDWRIAEARLHTLDLLGGIIGGLLAQLIFRHKIAKPGFGGVSAVIAALHALGLGALAAGLVHLPPFG